MFRIGEARLQLDTVIDQGSRAPQLLPSLVLSEGFLGESYLATPALEAAPDRNVLGREGSRDDSSLRRKDYELFLIDHKHDHDTAPDPAKHVNYNVGMVLGVDDFTQEFAYLSGRDQWMARDLIGYGTVRGLKVATEIDSVKGPRVIVDPGVAVSPERTNDLCAGGTVCLRQKIGLPSTRRK